MRKIVPIALLMLAASAAAGAGAPAAGGDVGVAVLTFATRDEPWLGRGAALLVEAELLRRDGVRVLDREHLDALLAEAGLAERGLVTEDARRALAAGAVDVVVTGTVAATADGVEVRAAAISAATGETVAAASAAGPREDLANLAARVAAELAAGLARRNPEIGLPPRYRLPPATLPEVRALADAADAEAEGDFAAAYAALRRGLAGRPGSPPVGLALGRLLLRMDEPEHAALALRNVVGGEDGFAAAEALSIMARVFEHDLKRYDRAAAAYAALIDRYPNVRDTERQRTRRISLLDRAGDPAGAYRALMESREYLAERRNHLVRSTGGYGYDYEVGRLWSRIVALDDRLAERWTELPDELRHSVPTPLCGYEIDGDEETVVWPEPAQSMRGREFRQLHFVAPRGRTFVRAVVRAETAPPEAALPGFPSRSSAVRIAAIDDGDIDGRTVRLGASGSPRGVETGTIDLRGLGGVATLWVEAGAREVISLEVTLTTRRGGETRPPPRPAMPEGTRTLASGVEGEVGSVSPVRTPEGFAVAFTDVARGRLSTGFFPWSIGKDADLYLLRVGPDGTPGPVRRLPLSSEREDLFPSLTRTPDGRYRIVFVSDRLDGRIFRLYTAVSDDLEKWSLPRPIDLGLRVEERAMSEEIRYMNLGSFMEAIEPEISCGADGIYRLVFRSGALTVGAGPYLATSPDGERWSEPIPLPAIDAGCVRTAAGGGTEILGVERGELQRIVVRDGRGVESERRTLVTGIPSHYVIPPFAPLPLPDGSAIVGVVDYPRDLSPEQRRAPPPWRLRLFRLPADGDPEPLGAFPIPYGGPAIPCVPLGDRLAVLCGGAGRLLYGEEGGSLRMVLLDLPGVEMPPAPTDAPRVELPPATSDGPHVGPVAVAILPAALPEGRRDVAPLADALLAEAFANVPGLRLVERDRLDAALGEQALAGRFAADGAARLGRLVAADRVVAAEVLPGEDGPRISIAVVDARTSEVLARVTRTAKEDDLPAALSAAGAEAALAAAKDAPAPPERRERDSAARLAFVRGVAARLAGDPELAAGGFFESLRLGAVIPATRYWLARALEDLGEAAGAAREYRRYLDGTPGGPFLAEAAAALDRLAGAVPEGSEWFPAPAAAAAETAPATPLARVYRSTDPGVRLEALDAYVAKAGAGAADVLLSLVRSDSDPHVRIAALSHLERVDLRAFLRAVGRTWAGELMSEMDPILRRFAPGDALRPLILESLAKAGGVAESEVWAGLRFAYQRHLRGTEGAFPEVEPAIDAALTSDDAVRIGRALDWLDLLRSPTKGRFDAFAAVFEDEEFGDDLRRRAVGALLRADRARGEALLLPYVLAGRDARLIAMPLGRLDDAPPPEELVRMFLDPALDGYAQVLAWTVRRIFPDHGRAVALEAMESRSERIREEACRILYSEAADLTAEQRRCVLLAARRAANSDGIRLLDVWLRAMPPEEAEETLHEIRDLPSCDRPSALAALAARLGFRPAPIAEAGLDDWLAWLRYFRAERAKTGPLLVELRARPGPERAREILAALDDSSDPEAVRAIADWWRVPRPRREAEAVAELEEPAFETVRGLLERLGWPPDRTPASMADLGHWIDRNDPADFRPWRK